MRNLFEQFVRDRRYLKSVSPRTEGWYWESWKAYALVLQDASPESLGKGTFLSRIEEMRTRGVNPITINTYSRAINAFLHWLHQEGYSPALVKVPGLKEEQKIMATLTGDQIRRLGRCTRRYVSTGNAPCRALSSPPKRSSEVFG